MEAVRARSPEPRAPTSRRFGSLEPLTREAALETPLRSWPSPATLEAPITTLRGAGPKLAEAAAELGIADVGDLLWHLPHSYRDRSEVARIDELKLGEEATLLVEVERAKLRPTRRRRLTIVEAKVADESGSLTAIWFNQAWLAERLEPESRLLIRGKLDKRGFRVSDYELLDRRDGSELPAGIHTTGLVPVHPASERLRAQRIREWVWQAIALAPLCGDPLPAALRRELEMPSTAEALRASHFPQSEEEATRARRRLAFEELVLYQASLASRRRRRQSGSSAAGLPEAGEEVAAWLDSLPFELTRDQLGALDEIDADMRSEQPMQRLLMGEVGSGKTVVAVWAMLRAVEAGHQAALMAPTETLAEQHFATLIDLLGDRPISFALLTGAASEAQRRERLARLASGELSLVVGTHALIEETVEFADLSVAVVDEQHRFGVRQRAALDAKLGPGRAPHTLHMTATPIPRTLSLTAYGDLDATTLRELPRGRKPVATAVVEGEEGRPQAYEMLRRELREGRQAYVVCPLVSESDALQAAAATEEAKRLGKGELADFRVDVLHGQMPSTDKQAAMERFSGGETDVLVATSVIEVGIDVANATVMIIEGAERYGLSQLHQLRGRVGRGEHQSSCVLFAEAGGQAATARLEAIAKEHDGFKLAEVDLSIRGEGEVLGTRQHGLPRFRAAVLPDDTSLLLEARKTVLAMLRDQGSLESPALGPLLDEARRRFGDERLEQLAA